MPENPEKDNKAGKCLELFALFFKIGLFTFGGGYAMIPLIEAEIVEKKKWISNDEFLDIIAIAESTPGPIAVNSATYIGYRKKGFLGALFATLGVIMPSFLIILMISLFFLQYKENIYIQYAFKGIRVGVSILIIMAGLRLFKKLKKDIFGYIMIAVGFFIALFDLVPVLILIAASGVIGLGRTFIIMKRQVSKND
ncbi:MAG TPA: chromate transporter [Bacillota bacterium]|nr:chromate transporter [Bacillota bacterium]HPJ85655.1 chromate transporter [Bacillota bacterium]HPQ61708.1 chromate transporter [Bacillota bacterium]HRX92355.1 chromate transporter [Candidatus Izemoplasmatales bacterium]